MYSRASLYTASLSTDFADTRFLISSKNLIYTDLIAQTVWRNFADVWFFMSLYNNPQYTVFEIH